jgi:hypothetical protein
MKYFVFCLKIKLITYILILRPLQKYLMNVSYIKSLLKGNPLYIKLSSGTTLQVSRFKKADLLKFFLH